MKLIAVAVFLVLSGCLPPAPTAVVVVPGTREGKACWRECLGIYNTCRTSEPRSANLGPPTNIEPEDPCAEQWDECRLTCPGARVEERVAGR